MNHGNMNEGSTTFRRALVVFRQTPCPIPPSKRTFDDPAFRLDFKATRWTMHDFHKPGPKDPGPLGRASVGCIHPNHFGKFDVPMEFGQRQLAAHCIRHRSRCDHQGPQQAEGINDQVPLAANHLFSPRRSLAARPVPSSSPSGYRGWRPMAWVSSPLAVAPAREGNRATAPTFHLSAINESSERQSDRMANHGAESARFHRCGFGKGWHSRCLGDHTLPGAHQALVSAQEEQCVATAHP